MAEADRMRLLQIKATALGSRLLRQQVGMGWIGEARKIFQRQQIWVYPGDVIISNARPFHSGFEGWSDLGGFTPVEVTADMVGTTVAVYAQVEVKVDTAPTKEQMTWINFVNKSGGRAGIAHDENELADILLARR